METILAPTASPDCQPARATELSFVAAVALGEALSHWIEVDLIALKWPNDVLLAGLKVGGILVERSNEVVVVGMSHLGGHAIV